MADEFAEGEPAELVATPITPRRLDTVFSVRFSFDELSDLQVAAERRGSGTISAFVRTSALEVARPTPDGAGVFYEEDESLEKIQKIRRRRPDFVTGEG
jgi:hypothetical protein